MIITLLKLSFDFNYNIIILLHKIRKIQYIMLIKKGKYNTVYYTYLCNKIIDLWIFLLNIL